MARWFVPTAEQIESYTAWVAERPPAVRAIAERFTPWELYRLKTTNQRVTVVSVYENGTIRVNVPARYNAERADLHIFDNSNEVRDFGVFGIDPDNLEPCEVPEHMLAGVHDGSAWW